jgi:heat-inducible transcriptional repressor
MNDRSLLILKALIDHYIQQGEPVGSRMLSQRLSLGLSAATIRNVLAELEEQGYIYAPHTSSGRVPTEQGYRFFIDCLLTIQPVDVQQMAKLRQQFNPEQDLNQMLTQASSLLSGFTYHVGLVTVPKLEQLRLRHVEFLSLGDGEILVILVLNDRDVQNRIIHTKRHFSTSELEQAANYLNKEYAGKDLHRIRKELLQALANAKEAMDNQMQTIIDMSTQALSAPETTENVVVAGHANIINLVEEHNKQQLYSLLDSFTHQSDIFHLLDKCLQSEGTQIFIGAESGHELLSDCSMITSTYKVNGKVVGVMGVLGPTRMQYEKVIPFVDVTARLLSASLETRG